LIFVKIRAIRAFFDVGFFFFFFFLDLVCSTPQNLPVLIDPFTHRIPVCKLGVTNQAAACCGRRSTVTDRASAAPRVPTFGIVND